MATYSRRSRTEVYQEVALAWPTNVVELEKAIAVARMGLVPGSERDDTFNVTHNDDELIIRWTSHTRLDRHDDMPTPDAEIRRQP